MRYGAKKMPREKLEAAREGKGKVGGEGKGKGKGKREGERR